MGGMTAVNGFPDNPTRCGVSIGDFSAGFFTAFAIMGALFHRMKTGEGQTIDISMQECIWQLTSIEFAPYVFLNGENPPRLGNRHSGMIPCNLYPTKDGRIFIMAGVLDQVRRLYTTIGREDLINTPLCANQNERCKHRDEIDEVITSWTKTKKTDEIVTLLRKADLPCSRFPTYEEVCHNPQLLSRNAIIEVEQEISGKVKVPGSLFKLSKTPGKINFPAPFLGQHNHEVLSEMLGYSQDELIQLADEGIF